MPGLSKTMCSGAFILHCTETGNEMKGCFVDESDNADNYRGELLGALGPLLLIRAAAIYNGISPDPENLPTVKVQLHCDNKGIVGHGNNIHSALKQDQKQADLIRLMKTYTRLLPVLIEWGHVHGHADRYTSFHLLTLIEQLNVLCDTLAKRTLIDCISSREFTPSTFPLEDITISIGSSKIRSSIRQAIYKHWGRSAAKSLFSKREKVLRSSFDHIYWDCMKKVSSSFPKTFQDWVT
jgi:hypothetical protein